MTGLLCLLGQVYIVAMFARIILSYFPLAEGGPMAAIYSFTYTVTEPVLGPVRRIIPPLGMFDMSSFIVLIVIQVLLRAIGC